MNSVQHWKHVTPTELGLKLPSWAINIALLTERSFGSLDSATEFEDAGLTRSECSYGIGEQD